MTDTTEKPAEAPKTLGAALAAVQTRIPSLSLGKDAEGQVQSRKYKYLTLEKLHEEVIPVLLENGLLWQTLPSAGKLAYSLTHMASGEGIKGYFDLHGETPQQLGSEISYFRRYSLLCVTGIVPAGEDDDGAKASEKPRNVGKTKVLKKDDEADRPVTDEELTTLLTAVKAKGANIDLLLASVGAEDTPSVGQAREIFRRLNA